jgi:hypothetical protein
MRRLLVLAFQILPIAAGAQSLSPSIEAGYGITQSRNRSGAAAHMQGSIDILKQTGFRVRGELFYQQGTVDGYSKCERFDLRYCIGTSDRNRIAGLSGTIHMRLWTRRRISAYAPIGVGVYRRETRTTETEGPILLCPDGEKLAACGGNPPLQSISYTTRAIRPGYNVGVGFAGRVGTVDLFVEMRAHDILESHSMAGAVPFSIGARF